MMNVFDEMTTKEHEQIIFCYDKATSLKAIIAIHNTVLGPALGGCRMWPYENEGEALNDALRLSRGMTYKSAAAGLNLGGGKAVIIGDAKALKSEYLFRAFGRFVQTLNGRYITAEDVGTSVSDMEWVHMETNFVTGIPRSLGGSGDPSPVTAFGVFHGLRAAIKKIYGSDSFQGRTITIQGMGKVGFYLTGHLLSAGAKVIASDIDEMRIRKARAQYDAISFVPTNEIYDVPCDIFTPCALGGTINSSTIPRLRCKIVAGSANNVLENEESDGLALEKRGILYIPDYIISAGGIINVSIELSGYNRQYALGRAAGIFDVVEQLLTIAEHEQISTLRAANTLAERRIAMISNIKRISIEQTHKGKNRA
jgi:leucine dehydrogenase